MIGTNVRMPLITPQTLTPNIHRVAREGVLFRHAFVNAIGPRIAAQKWQDVFPTITTGYAYPWETLKVKE